MMIFIMWLIAVCSILGPIGLCVGVYSRYPFTRIVFAMVACACSGLMWFLFGAFFGADIITEFMMYMMPIPEGPGT